MPIQQYEYAEFTYELCFLRLLSIRTFKDITNIGNISLSKFVDEYYSRINTLVKEDLESHLVNEIDINHDIDEYIKLAYLVLDELKGIGKFIELEILSEIEDKQKMTNELEDFIDEFECRNLERKQMPYRDIAKKYEESKA